MQRLAGRKLVVPLAIVAVLAGAAGAVAATQSSSGSSLRQAYLNDLANRLGVSPSTLGADMKGATEDQINAALAAGRLTQAQANALKQRVEQGTGLGSGTPFLGRGLGRRGQGLGIGGLRIEASAVAQYLGVSDATLRSDLASGKSLADITGSISGKSLSGLETAITGAATARLDKAVANGRITGQQEQQLLSTLSSRLGSLVQQTWTGGGGPSSGHGIRGHRALFGRRSHAAPQGSLSTY